MNTVYSIGIMTGTSCDGADLALLKFTNVNSTWTEKLVGNDSVPFPGELRKRLRIAQMGRLNAVDAAILSRDYSLWLSTAINLFAMSNNCQKSKTLLAIHGQTIWHDPGRSISIQLLEPATVAFETQMSVVCAFRQPDLARGGQGAPLVPLYHWLRARQPEFKALRPFAIHNVGGIGNLTYITKNSAELTAFDTGPGNALIDLSVEKYSNGKKSFDKNGAIAKANLGSIDWKQLERLAAEEYFKRVPPKSTGRELFNESYLKKLPGRGALLVANATAFTALTMAQAYGQFLKSAPIKNIFIAGGGAKNTTLVTLFREQLHRVMKSEKINVAILPSSFAPAHSLEAMAFARLGFEAMRGKPISLASATGAIENATGAVFVPAKNFLKLIQILNMR